MSRQFFSPEMFIFKVAAVVQAAFTTDYATNNLLTSNAHGLSIGDCLQFTTATTLPSGLSLTTNYYVISITTNTFGVSATPNGPSVKLTDDGTGTHTFHLKGKFIYNGDWRDAEVGVYTSGNANMTLKFQGSDQDNVDFNAAASPTNRWSYLQIKDLDNENATNGSDGIVLSGTDIAKSYEININGKKWVTGIITSWSAGKLNLAIKCFNDSSN